MQKGFALQQEFAIVLFTGSKGSWQQQFKIFGFLLEQSKASQDVGVQ